MKTISKKCFFGSAAALGALLSLTAPTAASAAGNSTKDSTVVSCPAELNGLRLSFTTKYVPPQGWGHADAKGIKSKGGAHSDLTPVVIGHSVESRNLICRYGYGSGDRKVRLASIRKTMPKNLVCTAEPEFRFLCVSANN